MCAVALASPRLSKTTHPPGRERAESRELERALLVRYHQAGDLEAREELVQRFLPFARELARRYAYADEPFDDLLQVASLGLLKALDRFDPDRGAKFTSFAAPTILGELKRHFRDKGWALHVSRNLQERSLAVSREAEELAKQLGRSPKPRDVAQVLGWSVEEVLEAQQALASYEAASLDAPATREEADGASVIELLGGDDSAYDLVEERDVIARTWDVLPEIERSVLELRFTHDLNQREIGERLGYSQMHVSRVLRRALGRIETAVAAA
jgi:RNA polymerase sigma-B factor